jgi:inosine-uridine nucleoside N-ribohydrolase
MMGGAFPEGKPEYNIETDIPSAKKLFAEWPTHIVASGYEIGNLVVYPASSILKDYGYVADHPLAESYREYMKMPYDRPMWDPTATLYAVRTSSFSLSPRGTITVGDSGRTHFAANAKGQHQYLTATPEQAKGALRAIIELASRPPDRLMPGAKERASRPVAAAR